MRMAQAVLTAVGLILALATPVLAGQITLSTPLVVDASGTAAFECSALNVGTDTLSISIVMRDASGSPFVSEFPHLGDCSALAPGLACSLLVQGIYTTGSAFCQISYVGSKDAVRGALELISSEGTRFAVEAR